MNEMTLLALLFFWGIGLAVVYFGGLWLTVRKGLKAESPGIIFSLSLIVRLAVVLAGFYFALNTLGFESNADPFLHLAVTFGGFLIGRVYILRYTKSEDVR